MQSPMFADNMSISFKHEGRLTKNGMKTTHGRTIARLTKDQRSKAHRMARQKAKKRNWVMPEQAQITVTQYYARKPMDYDGLACASAPAIDGLIDAGIIKDDSPQYITDYRLRHVKVSTVKEARVEVCVSSVQKS